MEIRLLLFQLIDSNGQITVMGSNCPFSKRIDQTIRYAVELSQSGKVLFHYLPEGGVERFENRY
jgi:hypothetical protein